MLNNFQKTLVLGIDGLSLSLARHLSARGIFRNLAGIAGSPNAVAVRSELPDVSPVNWTSFYTGSGPEKHGIYGFTFVDPTSYGLFLVDYSHVKAEAVWDWLGSRGMTSRIINLPCTYPAPALRGMLISGFVAPDLDNAVYPRALLPMLKRIGYMLEADTIKGLSRPGDLLEELSQTIAARIRAFDLFWPDLAFDFFMIVFTELDRAGHFLQDAILDQSHPLHRKCSQVLAELDSACGYVLERFDSLPGPKRILVVADHGFTRLEQEVDINACLRAMGFLILKSKPENELDLGCMDMSSRAFALDPGRIYIHDKRRFALGSSGSIEYAGILDKIVKELLELEYKGHKVIKKILRAKDIYPSGIGLPPDLLCVPHKGFDLKAKFDREDVFGHFGRTGTHCPEDVFFYDSQGSRPERIRDILPGTGLMDRSGRIRNIPG